jgi:hypothetical protein
MKVISGGQTGADRAALDAARELGLPTGGQAPANFWTENGPDRTLATLGLTAGGSLAQRTVRNVVAADATLIFACRPSPGSDLTARVAAQHRKPCCVVDPFAATARDEVVAFLTRHRPAVLNVAGHRESKARGIYDRVRLVLCFALGTVTTERPPTTAPAPRDDGPAARVHPCCGGSCDVCATGHRGGNHTEACQRRFEHEVMRQPVATS